MTEESGKFDINSDSFLWLKLENNFAFIIISRGGDIERYRVRGKIFLKNLLDDGFWNGFLRLHVSLGGSDFILEIWKFLSSEHVM